MGRSRKPLCGQPYRGFESLSLRTNFSLPSIIYSDVLMIKDLFVISAFVAICLISSCAPVVYAPVGQNVPLLKNKGDITFNASAASTEDAGGVGLQFASALDSSFALISSLYFMGHKSEDNV